MSRRDGGRWSAPVTVPPLVLAVEDAPANLALVRALLRRGGYRSLAAGSLSEARLCLAGETPERILPGLGRLDGDGLELLGTLRGDSVPERIPAVALTAYAMGADRERAHRLAQQATGHPHLPGRHRCGMRAEGGA